ncbi:hypothetical protein Pmani_011575 [Petrolisthes manimaculis]|uniref:Uncharacterized protein n=1 Tax=Petrolisthes manimaculis TaxID=1843537 RepID=A0AAE1PZ59_9EUCA|nr:hypothetical protein Pmani_011575 [Petrolisthes manimaculis]
MLTYRCDYLVMPMNSPTMGHRAGLLDMAQSLWPLTAMSAENRPLRMPPCFTGSGAKDISPKLDGRDELPPAHQPGSSQHPPGKAWIVAEPRHPAPSTELHQSESQLSLGADLGSSSRSNPSFASHSLEMERILGSGEEAASLRYMLHLLTGMPVVKHLTPKRPALGLEKKNPRGVSGGKCMIFRMVFRVSMSNLLSQPFFTSTWRSGY